MADDLTSPSYWDGQWMQRQNRLSSLWWQRYSKPTWYRSMIARMIDQPSIEKQRILEIGCAPGGLLKTMADLRPQHEYSGIDSSPEGVALTKQWLQDQKSTSSVYLSDMRTAELPHQYDLVMSFGLIEHFSDPIDALRHHLRLTRPGGWVAVSVPNYSPSIVRNLMQRFDPQSLETHNLEIMYQEKLRAALQAAGLTNIYVSRCGGPRVRAGYDKTRRFARAYRFSALAWNTVVSPLPSWMLWSSMIWGAGQSPVGTAVDTVESPNRNQAA